MPHQRIRWFLLAIPMAVLGALIGWIKTNGSTRDDSLGAIVGAAFGYVLGVGLSVAINGLAPGGSEEQPLAARERRVIGLLVVVIVALAVLSVLAL